jgi:hypothetical protein
VYPQLISLTIGNWQLPIQNLENLLSLTPSLVHLKLGSFRSTIDSIFVGSYWEQFIQNNLPLLNKFQFFLTYSNDEFNDNNSFDSLILPFQSPFWLNDKHWFVTCDYIPRASQIRLYTTPTFKDTETGFPTFQVSSMNSECRIILDSNENNLYNITGEVSPKCLSHVRKVISKGGKADPDGSEDPESAFSPLCVTYIISMIQNINVVF